MAFGWAGSVAHRFGQAAVVAAFLSAPAFADQNQPPATAPLSPACAVPADAIATPAPLPHLAALLPKSRTIHILAIGSSSTYGIGASSEAQSYPTQLESMLETDLKGVDVEIINRGIAGEVAETTAERITTEVALSKPDLVLWQLGTNDALERVPPEEFAATVRSTVEWLKSQGIDVVLVGLQYTPLYAKDANYFAIRQTLSKIAAQENVLYVRRYDAMQFIEHARANEQLMARDDFHLNDLGYRCMAEHVARAVVVNLFVKRTVKRAPAATAE
ncbi:MAG TPA: GDSL-type esterase/lipase family protein [Methylovirgula sp.]|nr:GDSL-type esterase/lipase family protein [Methylovirgula sp.]